MRLIDSMDCGLRIVLISNGKGSTEASGKSGKKEKLKKTTRK